MKFFFGLLFYPERARVLFVLNCFYRDRARVLLFIFFLLMRQAGRQAGKQADRQADRRAGRQAEPKAVSS
jgi:hypothetical protein